MTAFCIKKETRDGESRSIGIFSTFEKAHKVFLEELCLTEEYEYSRYGSNLKKGLYYSEEISLEIVEQEVQ